MVDWPGRRALGHVGESDEEGERRGSSRSVTSEVVLLVVQTHLKMGDLWRKKVKRLHESGRNRLCLD